MSRLHSVICLCALFLALVVASPPTELHKRKVKELQTLLSEFLRENDLNDLHEHQADARLQEKAYLDARLGLPMRNTETATWPTTQRSTQRTTQPTTQSTTHPTTATPSTQSTTNPTTQPISQPTTQQSTPRPTTQSPSTQPTMNPTTQPTTQLTTQSTSNPTTHPPTQPSTHPTTQSPAQQTTLRITQTPKDDSLSFSHFSSHQICQTFQSVRQRRSNGNARRDVILNLIYHVCLPSVTPSDLDYIETLLWLLKRTKQDQVEPTPSTTVVTSQSTTSVPSTTPQDVVVSTENTADEIQQQRGLEDMSNGDILEMLLRAVSKKSKKSA